MHLLLAFLLTQEPTDAKPHPPAVAPLEIAQAQIRLLLAEKKGLEAENEYLRAQHEVNTQRLALGELIKKSPSYQPNASCTVDAKQIVACTPVPANK